MEEPHHVVLLLCDDFALLVQDFVKDLKPVQLAVLFLVMRMANTRYCLVSSTPAHSQLSTRCPVVNPLLFCAGEEDLAFLAARLTSSLFQSHGVLLEPFLIRVFDVHVLADQRLPFIRIDLPDEKEKGAVNP